jgi:2-amino-4-hydroxy-6-hydroxymethyldihydropteridine diphosphokinase
VSAPVDAFVALGSNLAAPERQLQRAVAALASVPATRLVAVSRNYRTAPVGPPGQPDYLNAVAHLRTRLAPHALLGALLQIETLQGRTRGPQRWGPRTLDLDLLLYGSVVLDDPRLTLPHPRLHRRRFVLEPLAELAPGRVVPGLGPVRELLERLGQRGAGAGRASSL